MWARKQAAKGRGEMCDLLDRQRRLVSRVESVQDVDIVWLQQQLRDSNHAHPDVAVKENLLTQDCFPDLWPIQVFGHYRPLLYKLHLGVLTEDIRAEQQSQHRTAVRMVELVFKEPPSGARLDFLVNHGSFIDFTIYAF